MLGAIVGDIMGSSMEFEEQKFEHIDEINLFNEENHFTDDTVLTLAVADWLLHDMLNNGILLRLLRYLHRLLRNHHSDHESILK